ncbi:MAG: response regulator transcription factor [Bacteroidota bacterium]|nr:response regulator transcription factor [Bacteroidota bacterium]
MKKPKIIIVDDNQTFRQSLILLITIENIAEVIGKASNGIEFMDLLVNNKPDLVLMDIDMPEMNGIEATQRALGLIPDLKVIVFSMYGNEEYYTKMIDLGVKGYILKTCHINEFEKAIREVMKGGNYFFTNLKLKNVKTKDRKESDQILSENSDLTVTEIKLIQNIYSNSSN